MGESARRRRRTQTEWQEMVEEQAASGMDVETFCREHDIGCASFYAWRRRLNGKSAGASAGFVELKRPRETTRAADVVVRCGALAIELHGAVDEWTLRRVLRVAAETVADSGRGNTDAAAG